MTALDEAKQALADCPADHRIPLHFRNTVKSDTTSAPIGPRPTEEDDLDATIPAPEGQQEADSHDPKQPLRDLSLSTPCLKSAA